jgi:hypothetical protein
MIITRAIVLMLWCIIAGIVTGCSKASTAVDSAAQNVASHEASAGPVKPWGLYQILWQPQQFIEQLDRELKLLGGNPSYVLFFRDLHPQRSFPRQVVAASAQRGLTAVVSLELTIWGRDRPGYLQEIVDGVHDQFFREWGHGAAAWGEPVLLRFGFEMNGDWFHWGRQPDLFQRAWRRAHRLMVEVGADNVTWVYAPNVLYGDLAPDDGLHAYYPGDAFVDMVALDGYNFGDDHSEWHRWQSFAEVFEASIAAMATYPQPLLLSEVGCADDPRKAAWQEDALRRIQADPRIAGIIFFHFDKRREGEHNWRLDSDPASLTVFHDWLSRYE